jgi:acetolactate synthase-1/2/3 large subunit
MINRPLLDLRPAARPVARQIVECLEQQGIDRVFGIPGGTISPIFDALTDSSIEVVVCQHETMAVYLASGYARATGQPGTVLVTSGPGVLNAVTGVAAAYQDEIPIVVMAGDVVTGNRSRGALQDGGAAGLDIASMMRPITKLCDALEQPERAGAMVQQALRAAQQAPMGPSFLRIPVDMSCSEIPTVQYGQAIPVGGPPDLAMCHQIAFLLAKAERPAFFLGLGSRSGQASKAILELAEWARCPVMTDVEAKGVFPESHPLSLGLFGVGSDGRAERYLEQGVDLLITVGARLDDTTTRGFSPLLREADVMVQIDHDPRRICRSYLPDLALVCEPGEAILEIKSRMIQPSPSVLLGRDSAVSAARGEARLLPAPPLGEAPFDPRAVLAHVQAAFGPDTVFTSDIGNHLLFAARHLVVDRPDAFYVSNGLGGMGSGIGTAIGLAMAYGDRRRVVGICGDGGLLMVGNELATCAKYEIPVVLAVFDDGQLGMVKHGMHRTFGRTQGLERPAADLVCYARSLGVDALRIAGPQDLEMAATRAGRGPLVLDIPVDPAVEAANPRVSTLKIPATGS